MIKSVKLQESGYKVTYEDGTILFVPNDPANRHYQEVQEWINAGNEPEPQFTEEELLELKWNEIRSIRNELLRETDIYMLVDWYEKLTDEQKEELKDYRQKLRDIPQNFDNPDDVVFPDKPEFIKK